MASGGKDTKVVVLYIVSLYSIFYYNITMITEYCLVRVQELAHSFRKYLCAGRLPEDTPTQDDTGE